MTVFLKLMTSPACWYGDILGAIALTHEQPMLVSTSTMKRCMGWSAPYLAEPCTFFCISRQIEEGVGVLGSAAVIVKEVETVVVLPALSVAVAERVLSPSGSRAPEVLTPCHVVARPDIASLAEHGMTTA